MKKEFSVHTPNLLNEILQNNTTGIFKIPIVSLSNLLERVSQRASELNDPILNNLMCKLTLYSIADPQCDDYDLEKIREIEKLSFDFIEQQTNMKDEIIKSILEANCTVKEIAVFKYVTFEYFIIQYECLDSFNFVIFIFPRIGYTQIYSLLNIKGKEPVEIDIEVEPMDKDGAVAFAKNHLIEKLKEIL